jgi:hypothetical protein
MTATADDRHRLGVTGGLAALSLDAMASVAYGPEAIVLVLALGGASAVVCRLRLRIPDKAPETDVAPKLVSISHSARPDTTAAAGVIRRMTEDPYA